MLGTATLQVEVTHDCAHGLWLLLGDEQLLLTFEDFPWFRAASIDQLLNVQWPTPDHLYWPDLDIDLSVASIRQPDQFPLVSKAAA